jgi:hypothetical protein
MSVCGACSIVRHRRPGCCAARHHGIHGTASMRLHAASQLAQSRVRACRSMTLHPWRRGFFAQAHRSTVRALRHACPAVRALCDAAPLNGCHHCLWLACGRCFCMGPSSVAPTSATLACSHGPFNTRRSASHHPHDTAAATPPLIASCLPLPTHTNIFTLVVPLGVHWGARMATTICTSCKRVPKAASKSK